MGLGIPCEFRENGSIYFPKRQWEVGIRAGIGSSRFCIHCKIPMCSCDFMNTECYCYLRLPAHIFIRPSCQIFYLTIRTLAVAYTNFRQNVSGPKQVCIKKCKYQVPVLFSSLLGSISTSHNRPIRTGENKQIFLPAGN